MNKSRMAKAVCALENSDLISSPEKIHGDLATQPKESSHKESSTPDHEHSEDKKDNTKLSGSKDPSLTSLAQHHKVKERSSSTSTQRKESSTPYSHEKKPRTQDHKHPQNEKDNTKKLSFSGDYLKSPDSFSSKDPLLTSPAIQQKMKQSSTKDRETTPYSYHQDQRASSFHKPEIMGEKYKNQFSRSDSLSTPVQTGQDCNEELEEQSSSKRCWSLEEGSMPLSGDFVTKASSSKNRHRRDLFSVKDDQQAIDGAKKKKTKYPESSSESDDDETYMSPLEIQKLKDEKDLTSKRLGHAYLQMRELRKKLKGLIYIYYMHKISNCMPSLLVLQLLIILVQVFMFYNFPSSFDYGVLDFHSISSAFLPFPHRFSSDLFVPHVKVIL